VSSVLTGYPGAALLYAVAAAVLLPARSPRDGAAAPADASALGRYWSRVAWLALWIGAAFFTALPQTGEGGLVLMLSANQAEAPGPLRSVDSSELRWLTVGNETMLGITLAVACLAVGFAVFLGVLSRLFLVVSALIALAAWVATDNLGGILTGSTTDVVGTGPLLVLLALAFWPAGGRAGRWLTRQQLAAAATARQERRPAVQPAAGRDPAG
jgi:hypothetical protein